MIMRDFNVERYFFFVGDRMGIELRLGDGLIDGYGYLMMGD